MTKVNKKFIFYILLFTFHVSLFTLNPDSAGFGVFAQQPTLEWVARFHNIPNSYSLSSDDLGNIFVSGAYYNYALNKTEFLTLKYNTYGILQWYKLYNGPDTLTSGFTDIALINIADGCGNVYVGGNSSNNLFGDDILVIKYNSFGNMVWLARYQGKTNDLIAGMVKDKFGNIYVTGSGYGLPNTGKDYITIKYDSSGNKLWERTYNNLFDSPDFAKAIAVDSSQNVYVTGYCINEYLFEEYVTIKYNNLGVQQWVSKYFSTYRNSEAVSIAVDLNGYIYVTGFVDYIYPGFENYLTIKYDSLGNSIWLAEFNSVFPAESIDIPYKILIDTSNNVYITGSSTVKYNELGVFQWADTISPGKYSSLDNTGKLYVTGQRADMSQYWWIETAKYGYNGNKEWTLLYGKRQDTIAWPSDILVDRNYDLYILGNVYVGGQQNTDSILLFKYSQALGIISNYNQLPDRFFLAQNYPNPFNPNTVIFYDLPVSSNVNITVYNITGREIITLVNQKQNAGSYKIVFDGNGYSSGVYFYTLTIDGKIIDSKKMVLLR